MAAVLTPAADRVVEASAAAARVAELVGADTRESEVLHQSNNVVIRFADVVLKVSTDFAMAERDVVVASHVSATGGPALAPLLAPIIDGEFSISAWPYCPTAWRSPRATQVRPCANFTAHWSASQRICRH